VTSYQTPPAAAPPAAPAPAAPAAPAPAQPAQPDAGGQSATDAAGMDEVAWQVAAEADAQFSIVAEPNEGAPTDQAAVPALQQVPAPPAQTTG